MAEKNFFDLLKEKMAAFRPSARHRDEDWAALSAKLDQVLPPRPHDRQRLWVPLLLLLFALLLSNALWWKENRDDRMAIHRLEVQLAGLQTIVKALKPSEPTVRTDTVWRTVYIMAPDLKRPDMFKATRPLAESPTHNGLADRTNDLEQKKRYQPINDAYSTSNRENLGKLPEKTELETFKQDSARSVIFSSVTGQKKMEQAALLEQLDMPGLACSLSPLTRRAAYTPEFVNTPEPRYNTRPFGPVLLNALRPKYLKVGAIGGWLYPVSPALLHQTGLEAGLHGSVGFSRHWSLTAEYAFGRLHYESGKPEAVLGSPAFPALPSPDYRYAHLDLQRQRFRQFSFGLRYTFSQPGRTRPYIGLNWGSMTVLPYKIEYEVQNESNNTIQQETLVVDKRTHLRNTLRFGAGLEVPLTRRLDFTVEVFYLDQWKTRHHAGTGLTGLRAGANWAF